MGKNRHNTKRKRDDLDGSDAEDEQKKGNEKKNSHVQTNIYKSPNKSWSKATFKTNFWPGPAGEENPSDELKELRKLNGILARNNLDKCPPPVTTLDDDQLPSLFRDYCCNQSISIPSAVQMQTWPAALNGANVLAIAPTGSGKTLAYCLPAAVHILSQPTSHRLSNNKASPYVLVLSPTRELAIQIHAVFKSLRNISPAIKTAILYGGIEKEQQIDTLRNLGNQFRVLVATPGRLLDILQSADSPLTLDLVSLQVIDEADRMLAMGFLEQLQVVNEYLHPARQRLMFSATFPGRLRELSDIWLPNHVMIRCNAVEMNVHERKVKSAPRDEMVVEQSVDPVESDNTDDPRMEEQTEQPNKKQKQQQQEDTNISALQAPTTSTLTLSSSITQLIHICATHKKPRLLIKFIERIRKQEQDEKLRQAAGMVIFCNSIKTLGFVVSFLLKQEVKCVPLHSQLPQNLRETNLLSFKSVRFCFCFIIVVFLLLTLYIGQGQCDGSNGCSCTWHTYQATSICCQLRLSVQPRAILSSYRSLWATR